MCPLVSGEVLAIPQVIARQEGGEQFIYYGGEPVSALSRYKTILMAEIVGYRPD